MKNALLCLLFLLFYVYILLIWIKCNVLTLVCKILCYRKDPYIIIVFYFYFLFLHLTSMYSCTFGKDGWVVAICILLV